MEYSEIKQIIKDMENSKLAELSIDFPDGTKIKVKNSVPSEKRNVATVSNEKAVYHDVPKNEMQEEKTKDDNLKVVVSPMVGTFYAKPAPDAENFAYVGKKVKSGDVLCIIEAMKLMNEIESEYDGEIAEILVNDGDMVDYR